MKVYIERKNMQVQLKQISTLLTLESLKLDTFANDVFMKLGNEPNFINTSLIG